MFKLSSLASYIHSPWSKAVEIKVWLCSLEANFTILWQTEIEKYLFNRQIVQFYGSSPHLPMTLESFFSSKPHFYQVGYCCIMFPLFLRLCKRDRRELLFYEVKHITAKYYFRLTALGQEAVGHIEQYAEFIHAVLF